MKINKLTASFGKLENETLSFHDGLNVIYAPNESGKSTWCAFILAMLYGVDSSERAKAGYLPDKLRYAPWSGAPMEGTMELRADGCDITISRTTRAKNAPMREFSATYTGTSTPVRELNGANAGELLTGVSKEVFRRSAFVAQGSVAVTGAPELEKRINSIVSTGEEQTSYTEADEALRAWQRKRRYNRRGYLPELEGQIDEAQRRLEEMSGAMDALDAVERLARERRPVPGLAVGRAMGAMQIVDRTVRVRIGAAVGGIHLREIIARKERNPGTANRTIRLAVARKLVGDNAFLGIGHRAFRKGAERELDNARLQLAPGLAAL